MAACAGGEQAPKQEPVPQPVQAPAHEPLSNSSTREDVVVLSARGWEHPALVAGIHEDVMDTHLDELAETLRRDGAKIVWGPWMSRNGSTAAYRIWKGWVQELWIGRRTAEGWRPAATLPFTDTTGMQRCVSLSADGTRAFVIGCVSTATDRDANDHPVWIDLVNGGRVVLDDFIDDDVAISPDGQAVAYISHQRVLKMLRRVSDRDFAVQWDQRVTYYDQLIGISDSDGVLMQRGVKEDQESTLELIDRGGSARVLGQLPRARVALAVDRTGSRFVFRDGTRWEMPWRWRYGVGGAADEPTALAIDESQLAEAASFVDAGTLRKHGARVEGGSEQK
jgi:hypothetical protein